MIKTLDNFEKMAKSLRIVELPLFNSAGSTFSSTHMTVNASSKVVMIREGVYLPPEGRAGTYQGEKPPQQPGCQCATGTRPRESCLHRSEPTLISLKLLLLLKYLTQNKQKVLEPIPVFHLSAGLVRSFAQGVVLTYQSIPPTLAKNRCKLDFKEHYSCYFSNLIFKVAKQQENVLSGGCLGSVHNSRLE